MSSELTKVVYLGEDIYDDKNPSLEEVTMIFDGDQIRKLHPSVRNGVCAAMTVSWILLGNLGKSFPSSKQSLKDLIGIDLSSNFMKDSKHAEALWSHIESLQIAFGKSQPDEYDLLLAKSDSIETQMRKKLLASQGLYVVRHTRGILNASALADVVLSHQGFLYFGVTGKGGGHAVGFRIGYGTYRYMDPQYGELCFKSKSRFKKVLTYYWEEDYANYDGCPFDLFMVATRSKTTIPKYPPF